MLRRRQFFDRYFWVVFGLGVLLMFIWLLLQTNIIEGFQRKWWTVDARYHDWQGMLAYHCYRERLLEDTQVITQMGAPFYAGIAGLAFWQRKQNLYPFAAERVARYFSLLKTHMLGVSFKIAAASFCAYLVYYVPALLFAKPADAAFSSAYTSHLFSGLWGDNIWRTQPAVYYLADGLVREFLGVFILCILACVFALVLDRQYKAFLAIIFYTIGLSIVLPTLSNILHASGAAAAYAYYFVPIALCGFDEIPGPVFSIIFPCNVLPVALITFFCIRKKARGERIA